VCSSVVQDVISICKALGSSLQHQNNHQKGKMLTTLEFIV
jgi:hypothetical protein